MPRIWGIATWRDTSTHSSCEVGCGLRWWRQREDHSVMSLAFETARAGSNILPVFWTVNQDPRGGTGAPQEINASSIIIYLLTMTKPFHSSALPRMRGGGKVVKKLKAWKFLMSAIIESSVTIVHLLQRIPVTSEILTYCIAFLHSCNHINVFKGTANDIHISCPALL